MLTPGTVEPSYVDDMISLPKDTRRKLTLSIESYAACCRKYGHHTIRKGGSHNWNQEIIQAMVAELKAPWAALGASLNSECSAICDDVTAQVDDKIKYLSEDRHDTPDPTHMQY